MVGAFEFPDIDDLNAPVFGRIRLLRIKELFFTQTDGASADLGDRLLAGGRDPIPIPLETARDPAASQVFFVAIFGNVLPVGRGEGVDRFRNSNCPRVCACSKRRKRRPDLGSRTHQ